MVRLSDNCLSHTSVMRTVGCKQYEGVNEWPRAEVVENDLCSIVALLCNHKLKFLLLLVASPVSEALVLLVWWLWEGRLKTAKSYCIT